MSAQPPANDPRHAPPGYGPPPPPPPAGRPVSFYVAIFLGLLLLVSGGLNLLLLLFSAIGSAAGGLGTADVVEEDGGTYEMVAVGGDADADVSVIRIPINGAISEASAPLLGGRGGTVSSVRRALRAAARNKDISGILVDINSPGGGVTDSDEIHRLITAFKKKHHVKVLALLGDVAASGGYYVAAACDRIMARPTSITGSIGVIMSSWNYGEALAKLHIKAVTLKSRHTPFKDILSPTRPMTPEEEGKLLAIIDEMYQRFVEIVDEGRPGLSRDRVLALATGEIYSANQARENGLVDAVGTLADARSMIAEMIRPGLAKVRIVEHRRVPTLFERLFSVRSTPPTLDAAVARLLRASSGPRFLYFWAGGR